MIRNREGHEGYDVRWAWEDGPLPPGLTCVFRVKDEARNLPWVLPPMLEAVQHVVVVDNGSTDGTADVARRVAARMGAADRLTLASYPFAVARAGAEHLATPPDSVHSLTHFYNWSMAHVRTAYSMKWDGDMVLTREGVGMLADLSWQLEESDAVVAVPRHPLTVESDSVAWIDLSMKFIEPWIYPMGPGFTFVKAFEWEVREFPETSERIVLPDGLCVELKWLDTDEFAHWSTTDFSSATGRARAPRKRREWEVDRALRAGRGDEVPGLVRIQAPPGVHVVDHVTGTWLPQEPRPLVRRGQAAPVVVAAAMDVADVPAPVEGRVSPADRRNPPDTPSAPGVSGGFPPTGPAVCPPPVVRPAAQPASQPAAQPAAQPTAAVVAGADEASDEPGEESAEDAAAETTPRNARPAQDPGVAAAMRLSPNAANLRKFLDNALEPVLVLLHPDVEHLRDALPDSVVATVSLPAASVPDGGRWGTIVLAVPDRDALRRTAPALPPTRGATRVAIWVDETDRAIVLSPRPDWPVLTHLHARRIARSSALTLAIFGDSLPGHLVLAEFARQAVARDVGNRGLRVAVHGGAIAPPGDVNALRVATVEDAADLTRDVPPDVVVTTGARDVVLPEHPVIGRAPLVVDDRTGPLALGPLDERILNPYGFGWVDQDAVIGELLPTPDGAVVELGGRTIALETRRGATEAVVRELRPAQGIRLTWPEEEDRALARTVAGLAMTGVPLLSPSTPAWARALLGPTVSAAIAAEADLGERLAREEHSIVQRRAAMREFSSSAWRATVGSIAGVRVAAYPPVSVVLATKRPENLDFALRQVARQRDIDLELVLAPHGFEVDEARVRELVGDRIGLVVRPQPADVAFGDVLARATDAASGDLILKMDDDDWYSPDVVADLVLARTYSGAELVGMPAEFIYLGPRDQTLRRSDRSEVYARFVAGGTMLLEKGFLRSLGGFRTVRKYVDATLLSDVLGAGGAIYRTQGLGYVFRRGDAGHTWEAPVDFFLDPDRLADTWDGFRPSRLLEVDDVDRPTPA